MEEKPKIDIRKFILFHNRRISILQKLLKEEKDMRLIFQISFLGIESLAKLRYSEYPGKKNSKKRFIELLSTAISRGESEKIYEFWRCPLTHEGFIAELWTSLESWAENDIGFIDFPITNSIRSSTEFPDRKSVV